MEGIEPDWADGNAGGKPVDEMMQSERSDAHPPGSGQRRVSIDYT